MFPGIPILVTNVIAILAPYLAKGAKEFVEVAGEVAYEKAKSLLATLKAKLAGDKEATENLENFEKKPERYQPVMEDILKEKLAQDEDLAAELDRQVKEMGPTLEIIQKMKVAKDAKGLEADEFAKGKAKVIQEIDEAENVIGAKIGRIG